MCLFFYITQIELNQHTADNFKHALSPIKCQQTIMSDSATNSRFDRFSRVKNTFQQSIGRVANSQKLAMLKKKLKLSNKKEKYVH